MSIEHLRQTQREYATINGRAEAARVERDRAVIAELAAGTPQKEIMAATGLSRTRLAQIRNGTR